jgi:hypothetical protein
MSFNDTVGTERNHKVDKSTFQSSSRRKTSVFREMHERNVQRSRIKTFSHLQHEGEARRDMKVENIVDDNTVFGTIDKGGGRMAVSFTDDQWHVVHCQSSFLHPQIEMSTVTNLLVNEVTTFSDFHHDLIAKMTCPDENGLRISFIKGISCTPGASSGLSPFQVYATTKFSKDCKPRFDCVEVECAAEDGKSEFELAQILGIIAVVDDRNDSVTFLLIVTYLSICQKTNSDKYLPYDLLSYNVSPRYKGLQLDIIEPDAIFRPAMLIPCPDRSQGLYQSRTAAKKSLIELSNYRFWGIRYKTVDRFGYDDEQCQQIPETISAEDIYDRYRTELNSDESEVDSDSSHSDIEE